MCVEGGVEGAGVKEGFAYKPELLHSLILINSVQNVCMLMGTTQMVMKSKAKEDCVLMP